MINNENLSCCKARNRPNLPYFLLYYAACVSVLHFLSLALCSTQVWNLSGSLFWMLSHTKVSLVVLKHPDDQNQSALRSVDVASLRITVWQESDPLRDVMSLRRANSPPALWHSLERWIRGLWLATKNVQKELKNHHNGNSEHTLNVLEGNTLRLRESHL